MTSILTHEEIILLRKKYLPAVFRSYKKINDILNRISEKIDDDEEGDIWLSEIDQRRLMRSLRKSQRELRNANSDMRDYIVRIMDRLGENS